MFALNMWSSTCSECAYFVISHGSSNRLALIGDFSLYCCCRDCCMDCAAHAFVVSYVLSYVFLFSSFSEI